MLKSRRIFFATIVLAQPITQKHVHRKFHADIVHGNTTQCYMTTITSHSKKQTLLNTNYHYASPLTRSAKKRNHQTTRQFFPRKIRNQLPMVPIKLYGPNETCECYALLDSCSTISYVFDPMVTKLNAARTSLESTLSVSTAFGDSSMEAKLVQLDFGPFNSNKPLFRLNYVYSINNWHFDDAPVSELNDVCSKHPHLQHISFPQLENNRI